MWDKDWNEDEDPAFKNPYSRQYEPNSFRTWELKHGITNPNAKNPYPSYTLTGKRWQQAYDNYHATTQKEPTEMTTNKDQLYKHGEQYVKRLATDSKGQAVVEDASTGQIFAVDPGKLEMVVPYTVGVRFSTGVAVYHYLAAEGSVQKGDVLLKTDNGALSFAIVTDVATKSLAANVELKTQFRKFKTESL